LPSADKFSTLGSLLLGVRHVSKLPRVVTAGRLPSKAVQDCSHDRSPAERQPHAMDHVAPGATA